MAKEYHGVPGKTGPVKKVGSDLSRKGAKSMCQNCGRLWNNDDLGMIEDLAERVAPGEPMPSGECSDPECRALCQPVKIISFGQVLSRTRAMLISAEDDDVLLAYNNLAENYGRTPLTVVVDEEGIRYFVEGS